MAYVGENPPHDIGSGQQRFLNGMPGMTQWIMKKTNALSLSPSATSKGVLMERQNMYQAILLTEIQKITL